MWDSDFSSNTRKCKLEIQQENCDIRTSQSIMNQEMMTEYLFREVDRKSSIDYQSP
jgi:hypothetical protein